jgi:hypothetical protein
MESGLTRGCCRSRSNWASDRFLIRYNCGKIGANQDERFSPGESPLIQIVVYMGSFLVVQAFSSNPWCLDRPERLSNYQQLRLRMKLYILRSSDSVKVIERWSYCSAARIAPPMKMNKDYHRHSRNTVMHLSRHIVSKMPPMASFGLNDQLLITEELYWFSECRKTWKGSNLC